METVTKKVRNLIGENEIESAISELEKYLDGQDMELYDALLLQKRRYNAYRKQFTAGYAEEKEIAAITDQLLSIVRKIDAPREEKKTDHHQNRNLQPDHKDQIKNPDPVYKDTHQYVAKCVFFNDHNQYYLDRENRIYAVHAFNGATILVANKIPSMMPNIMWVYSFPNGMYYNVDMQGNIWGLNAFGQPMQMGMVQPV